MSNSASPIQILLLCENEQAAQLDKRALRDAGYASVKVMNSGIDAARLIARVEPGGPSPDIVICYQKLADMDSEQFCAIIRSHPLLTAFPILLILPNANEAEQMEAMGCGASALLARPFSIENLQKQIAALASNIKPLQQLNNADKKIDTSAFDAALASYGVLLRSDRQPDDYFRIGLRFLESKHWNYAITAFERAMRDAQIKAEAELGMAAAFKGKGDLAYFRAWLARAAETFVQTKRWQRARAAYARLLQHDSEAKNPFISETHRLIRLQRYNDAASVLAQGISLIPKRQIVDKFARICFMAVDPQAMFKTLEHTLAQEKAFLPESLSAEISSKLEVLAQEKDERQRRQAAERKWELSRKIGVAKPAPVENMAKSAPELRTEKAVAPLENDLPEDDGFSLADDYAELKFNDGEDAADITLAPLKQVESPEGASDRKSGGSDFLSVVKFTWNLAKRGKKKK